MITNRVQVQAWKVGEASVKNTECLALSESQVFRCVLWRTRGLINLDTKVDPFVKQEAQTTDNELVVLLKRELVVDKYPRVFDYNF
ncbi:hypothetical protein PIB30_025415 [Stylosanthes scabra]|uniref:Uncharacterized protein n=1 Tax=Stylosanthes scabra TaxID=79078 RepID=A0ABU6RAJ3_9FABA|nr:hypothetical protein [Stylosanthes scabra]